jgi:hypothetical protein
VFDDSCVLAFIRLDDNHGIHAVTADSIPCYLEAAVDSLDWENLSPSMKSAQDDAEVAPEEMGHPQTPTHGCGDNSTAIGIANRTIKQRRSKAMGMQCFWLQDREAQQRFKCCWDKGKGNLADCFTKHHSVAHHRAMRSVHLSPALSAPSVNNLNQCLRGCVHSLATRTTFPATDSSEPRKA